MSRSLNDKKLDAQDLYIFTSYTVEQIAEFCDLTARTIQNYIKLNNWDDLKAANNLTKPKIVQNLYKRILQLTEEDAIVNAQKIAMLANVLEKLDKKANASHYINVFTNFNKFLIENGELELAQSVNKHQSLFLDAMANRVRYV